MGCTSLSIGHQPRANPPGKCSEHRFAETSPCSKAAAGWVQVWLPLARDYVVWNAALALTDSIFTTPLWSRWLLQEKQLRHWGKVFVFTSISDSEE